ncbi:MAG: hypothetical protein U5J98_07225 [Halobacteriales archaeon]|nr:hypothetical protein [Halobacteriales archaeon]
MGVRAREEDVVGGVDDPPAPCAVGLEQLDAELVDGDDAGVGEPGERTGSMAASASSRSGKADGLVARGWRSSSRSRQCHRPSAS